MPSIGRFGVARHVATPNPEPVTFDYADQTFRLTEADPSALPLMEFADAAESGLEAESMQGMAAMYRLLRSCIHPDDWARFRAAAVRAQADAEDLLEIVAGVWGHFADRPTVRSTESPDGPPPTGTGSKPASSSPATDQRYALRPELAALEADAVAVADLR